MVKGRGASWFVRVYKEIIMRSWPYQISRQTFLKTGVVIFAFFFVKLLTLLGPDSVRKRKMMIEMFAVFQVVGE